MVTLPYKIIYYICNSYDNNELLIFHFFFYHFSTISILDNVHLNNKSLLYNIIHYLIFVESLIPNTRSQGTYFTSQHKKRDSEGDSVLERVSKGQSDARYTQIALLYRVHPCHINENTKTKSLNREGQNPHTKIDIDERM